MKRLNREELKQYYKCVIMLESVKRGSVHLANNKANAIYEMNGLQINFGIVDADAYRALKEAVTELESDLLKRYYSLTTKEL